MLVPAPINGNGKMSIDFDGLAQTPRGGRVPRGRGDITRLYDQGGRNAVGGISLSFTT